MKVAVDIDGTIDCFPRFFQSLISALSSAGHQVYILTGVSSKVVTPADLDAKRDYLTQLGISSSTYYALQVVPSPHDTSKAAVLVSENIDALFDNNKDNIKAAAEVGVVALHLWNGKRPSTTTS